MIRLPFRLLAIATLALALASCGDDDAPADVGSDTGQIDDSSADCIDGATDCNDTGADADPSMNACAPDVPDCNDTVVEDPETAPAPSE